MKFKNILSLFDGISCGQLALERAGIEYDNYYASEIDKNAINITQANYPRTIQLGDVRGLDFRFFRNVDLLIGGSPCQDLSIANENRKGLAGERSSLFYRFVDALEQCKPKYFLLENVASMGVKEREIITKTLGVEPVMIDSTLVSAQSRKRLYWTNIKGIEKPRDRKIFIKDILESETVGIYQTPQGKNNGGLHSEKSTTITANSWEYNNKVLEPLGCAIRTWPRTKDKGKRVQRVEVRYDRKANSLLLVEKSSRVLLPVDEISGKINGTVIKVENKTVTTPNGVTYPIDLPDGYYIARKLSPVECERLQTIPDNYTAHASNTQRYKAIGNGWTVDVITHIFKYLKEE